MSVSSRLAWSERQHRLRSLQSLDLRLLVQAQDDCICQGIQVQPDNVADLFFGFGIRRELEGLDPRGGPFKVRATIRAHLASLIVGGRPDRGLSWSPSIPSSTNLLRIRLIWTGVYPVSSATSVPET
jgi:hypothetical protein